MVFNPATDIPDLGEKVIFITGGTAGLGKESILALAKKKPAHIYFTGRDKDRAAAIIAEVEAAAPSAQLTFLECNMSSLSSVAEVAKQVVSKTEKLDILMCNAGISGGHPVGLTEDGYEVVFGTNHVAHALLIKLLLPTLLRTADSRVVVLTSNGLKRAKGIPFDRMRDMQNDLVLYNRYSSSKLANLLYTAELARRYPNLTAISIHPGIVKTGMILNASRLDKVFIKIWRTWNRFPLVEPHEGAHTQLWAATVNKEKLVTGGYYEPGGVLGQHTKLSSDAKLAGELWDWTEKELQLQGYPASG